MSNRDRIDRGMGFLAIGLGPFVSQRMAAAFPGETDWAEAMADRGPSRSGARRRYSLSDPRFLLRLITEEWRVFKDSLSRVEQGFAAELRDAGNRWAHGDPFSADDTYRTLDTIERLLAAVGAADQASQVRSLRLDLQLPAAQEAAAPSAGADAARAQRPVQRRPGHPASFWSEVGHGDVVRAIEEYDRLGQDGFLAEHGFGRADAYLLVYRGSSYDSTAILGVAYKFATGVRIRPHDFSGGAHGAAGVLRRLGFEVRDVQAPASQLAAAGAGTGTVSRPRVPATVSAPGAGPVPRLDAGPVRVTETLTLTGHEWDVASVAFSPDGSLLASADDAGVVQLWDPASGAYRHTLTGHEKGVWHVAFSPDGSLLASADSAGAVRLWDPVSGRHRHTLTGHEQGVHHVAFSADGSMLASASSDKRVRLWDPVSGRHRHTLTGHENYVRVVAFSPDGRLLASASGDQTVRLWDPASGAHRRTVTVADGFTSGMAFSPDGSLLASGSHQRTVQLWDPASGAHLRTLTGHEAVVRAVAFSPDGRLLASASAAFGPPVRLWDPASGALWHALTIGGGSVTALAFSPDGRLLAMGSNTSGSRDRTIRLWHVTPAAR